MPRSRPPRCARRAHGIRPRSRRYGDGRRAALRDRPPVLRRACPSAGPPPASAPAPRRGGPGSASRRARPGCARRRRRLGRSKCRTEAPARPGDRRSMRDHAGAEHDHVCRSLRHHSRSARRGRPASPCPQRQRHDRQGGIDGRQRDEGRTAEYDEAGRVVDAAVAVDHRMAGSAPCECRDVVRADRAGERRPLPQLRRAHASGDRSAFCCRKASAAARSRRCRR